MSRRVVVAAPAKVNLHLGVGQIRPDGFHAVQTVLQAVDLEDTVSLRPSGEFRLTCYPDLGIPAQENLVSRSATMLAARLGREPLVDIEISKTIPAGAGLGGGSSDAAAALAGLALLWDAPDSLLGEVAAAIGTDVPFFLDGGTALFGGRGEEFVQRIVAPDLWLVLVKPKRSVNTGAAYAEFDRVPVAQGSPDTLIAACEAGDAAGIAAALANNMERAATTLVPEVADALALVRGAEGVLGGAVAGSGSAVFGICESGHVAEHVAGEAASHGWWSVAARSRRPGVRVSVTEEAS